MFGSTTGRAGPCRAKRCAAIGSGRVPRVALTRPLGWRRNAVLFKPCRFSADIRSKINKAAGGERQSVCSQTSFRRAVRNWGQREAMISRSK